MLPVISVLIFGIPLYDIFTEKVEVMQNYLSLEIILLTTIVYGILGGLAVCYFIQCHWEKEEILYLKNLKENNKKERTEIATLEHKLNEWKKLRSLTLEEKVKIENIEEKIDKIYLAKEIVQKEIDRIKEEFSKMEKELEPKKIQEFERLKSLLEKRYNA